MRQDKHSLNQHSLSQPRVTFLLLKITKSRCYTGHSGGVKSHALVRQTPGLMLIQICHDALGRSMVQRHRIILCDLLLLIVT